MADTGARGEPGGWINRQAAVGSDGTGAERQRRYVPLANGTKAENEAQAAFGRTSLVGVRHDAGIEQCRGFERIFVQKIGAEKLSLGFGKGRVRRERIFHFVGAKLEGLQQIAMPALKVFQHFS